MMKKLIKNVFICIFVLPVLLVFSACKKDDGTDNGASSPVTTITESAITLEYASVEYDGEEKTPSVTVTLNGAILDSVAYTVSYENNIEVGTASVLVSAVEDSGYTGSATKTFEITKIVLSAANFSLEYSGVVYDGLPKTPIVSASYGKLTLDTNALFTVSYENNINVGTASVKIKTIKDCNYYADVTLTFAINQIYVDEECVSLEYEDVEYDGLPKTPSVIVVYNETVLEEGVDYVVSYYLNENIGTAMVQVSSAQNSIYNINVMLTFEITGQFPEPEPTPEPVEPQPSPEEPDIEEDV